MKLLDIFLSFILFIIAAALITGGHTFYFESGRLEVSSLDAWNLGLTLILALTALLGKDITQLQTWKYLERFISFLQKKSSPKGLISATLIIFGLLFLAHFFRHLSFNTHALDMTYLNQPLFYAFEAPHFKCDLCSGASRFSNHIGLSLYLIAPLTSFFKSDILVLFLQAGLIGAAIWGLIRFGPLAKKKELWLFALLLLVSHKAFRNGLIWDFKEDHLGEFFLILSYLFVSRRQTILFFLSVTGVLVSKEHTAFIVPLMAIPLWFEKDLPYSQKERAQLAIGTVGLSLLWGASVFGFLLDFYRESDVQKAGRPSIISRLGIEGESKSEVLMNLFLNPSTWWMLVQEKLLQAQAIKYLFLLYLPFVYILRKRWWWIVATLSAAAINIVSTFSTMRTFNYHYECFLLPTLFIGVLYALKDVQNKKSLVWSLLLMLSVSGRWPMHEIQQYFPSAQNMQDAHFLSQLNPEKETLAGGRTLAHLSYVRNIEQVFEEAKAEEIKPALSKGAQVVLDREIEFERELISKLRENEEVAEKSSRSGRFSILSYERTPLY